MKLIDSFTNKEGLTSNCFRIAYRSMERSLTDDEINQLQVSSIIVAYVKINSFFAYTLISLISGSSETGGTNQVECDTEVT